MPLMSFTPRALIAVLLCVGAVANTSSSAQSPAATGTLTGIVADPSGAVIPGAIVHVETHKPSAFKYPNTTADATGNYSVTLPPGTYDVTFIAPGFDPFIGTATILRTGAHAHLDAALVIATQAEQVEVSAESTTAATDNKSALVFNSAQLDTFSDDDSTFQQQIEALAGADPTQPSSVYVDGFSGGQIPPKESIREIRINSNPYSAQYQDLGFGRIEIFTKPGADKMHGRFMAFANDSALNTQNPFVGTQPPYYQIFFRGNLSGPIGKKTSFFVSSVFNKQQNNSLINALATETSNSPVNYAVASPTVNTDETLRLDRQVTANNIFTARYEFNYSSTTNGGLTALQTLPTEAYNSNSTTQTLQLSDSQNIGKNKILETRFQYIRSRINQNPVSIAPTVMVNGYFNGGGSGSQISRDNQDRYELQEYFSLEHKQHFFRIGGRYRFMRDANFSNGNFNGTFTYSSAQNSTVTALQNYQNQAPSQFSITTGKPSATIAFGDLSVYAEDEWKVRKNVALDFGFRAESQSAIPDHFDPAPRIGASWAIGQTDKKPPIVTLRTGFGLFYDRFGLPQWGQSGPTYLLTAVRRSTGTLEQQYLITNPSAACVSDPTLSICNSGGAAAAPTLYNVDPKLRSEYQVTTGLSAERTLGKHGTITVNYLHGQGDHQWTSLNINAPLPGTYNPSVPTSGVRPLGGTQNIYQFASNGFNETNMVFGNAQLNFGKNVNLWAFTGWRLRNGDTSGPTSFPTNQYHLAADYGRVSGPVYRLFTGGNFKLPYGITANPFIAYLSRQPFNITAGSDLNGDTVYNDRPSFATAASPASQIYKTAYGTFDATPQPGETIIPFNYGSGPSYFYTELGVRKGFHFGQLPPTPPAPPAKPGPDGKLPPPPPPPNRPYELAFGAEADNVFNHTNPAAPVGVLTSPQFGQSTTLNGSFNSSPNANRMLFFYTNFTF